VCVYVCGCEERGPCLTTSVGVSVGACERERRLNLGWVCVGACVCACEETGRCLTTLDGGICGCMCVCEERGRCLTTFVVCACVYMSMMREEGV